MRLHTYKSPESSFLSLEKDMNIIVDMIMKNDRLKKIGDLFEKKRIKSNLQFSKTPWLSRFMRFLNKRCCFYTQNYAKSAYLKKV